MFKKFFIMFIIAVFTTTATAGIIITEKKDLYQGDKNNNTDFLWVDRKISYSIEREAGEQQQKPIVLTDTYLKVLVEKIKQGNQYAWQELQQTAEQGDAQAQYYLGDMYNNVNSIELDYKKAIYWLTKSANNGNATAQYRLGEMYYTGDSVTQDKKQAVKWLTKASKNNHAQAQYKLGMMYHMGDSVAQDYKKAVHWWQKSAKQGNPDAQFYLDEMYANGQGVKQGNATAQTLVENRIIKQVKQENTTTPQNLNYAPPDSIEVISLDDVIVIDDSPKPLVSPPPSQQCIQKPYMKDGKLINQRRPDGTCFDPKQQVKQQDTSTDDNSLNLIIGLLIFLLCARAFVKYNAKPKVSPQTQAEQSRLEIIKQANPNPKVYKTKKSTLEIFLIHTVIIFFLIFVLATAEDSFIGGLLLMLYMGYIIFLFIKYTVKLIKYVFKVLG